MRPTNSPRRSPAPTTFTTVMCGYQEGGTILGRPGSWTARAATGADLGTYATPQEARRAIERHVEADRWKAR
jgi:hypothetical protein